MSLASCDINYLFIEHTNETLGKIIIARVFIAWLNKLAATHPVLVSGKSEVEGTTAPGTVFIPYHGLEWVQGTWILDRPRRIQPTLPNLHNTDIPCQNFTLNTNALSYFTILAYITNAPFLY